MASLDAQRRLSESTASLEESYEKLSSGLRINKPSDDAAGLAISSLLNADTQVFNQGVRTLNDGISVLDIADGSLSQLSNIVVRLRELATQSANGTVSNKQRAAIDEEGQALSKEFNRIARTTSFNGVNLFDATSSDTSLQAGYSQLNFNFGGAIGDGTFQPRTTYGVGSQPSSVAVGDFNGDGVPDLVSANSGDGTVSVLLGNGDGTFRTSTAYVSGTSSYSVAVGDFNGDGVADLVSANSGDGTVSVLLGNGDGTFRASTDYGSGTISYSVAVGDFNGDGVDDLVSTDDDGTVSVLLGNGDGTFRASLTAGVGSGPLSVEVGDFNGDGVADLVSADAFDGTVSVLLGNGDGTFKARTIYGVGSFPNKVVIGDFNGDGVEDLVSADSSGNTISVLLGNGDGTFGPRKTFAAGTYPTDIAVGDFNGDGIADLVASDRTVGIASVLLGNGDGTFQARSTFRVGHQPYSIAVGDFNGDGVDDLVSADTGDGTVSVLNGTALHGVSALQSFSLATRDGARSAMTYFSQLQTRISAQRGQIGAFQSRAEYAVNVLSITSEQLSAASSRITDVDVAEEAANLAKNRILQEAGAAVLAQANQGPALALDLLRQI